MGRDYTNQIQNDKISFGGNHASVDITITSSVSREIYPSHNTCPIAASALLVKSLPLLDTAHDSKFLYFYKESHKGQVNYRCLGRERL